MANDSIVGVWRLIKSEWTLPDGQTVDDHGHGRHAVGMLIYDPHGYVSIQIMRPNRPDFVSGDPHHGAPDEIKPAFEGYLGYFGTYVVDEEERIIIHKVIGSLFPNWVGEEIKRYFEFSGSRLILRTPPIPSAGTIVTGILIWERGG